MIKLDAAINSKKLVTSIQKGVDLFNKSTAGRSKLNLKINEKGFRQPLGRITGDLDKFESALAASNARVIAFGASTAVIGGMTKAFKELALTTIAVQKSFADINRILNVSNREFESFSTSLFNIGKKTATTFEDSSKAALEFARQGLGLNETLKRTADALTLVRLTGVNADKAVSALTATVNAFQKSSLTTTEALNKFVAVETQFAVSARDLMEGLGRVGSAAVDAKVNFNELNAMVAAVQQQTGRGGAVIGNALKTIFTRLQRRDTLTALESYGIAVRNIEGETRPAMAILQDFAKTYDTLADSNKAYLREQVAGVFQANILSAIVKDLNSKTQVYNKALTVSTNATNEADMANARLNKTLSALISQTGTELVRLQENLGKITFEPIAKGLLGPFKGLLEGINDVIDGEGLGSEIANGLLKGLRNVLAGPGLVGALAIVGSTIIKTVGFMAKALPTLVGITTETQKRANLETIISEMLAADAGLTKQIAANEGNAAVQAGLLLGSAQKAETAFAAAALTTAAIAANLAKAGLTANKAGQLVPRGRGAFGRGAGGFIPGVAGEMHDIQRGVGGVGSSARPVHLPNFAFGGGHQGSMVANTGEHVVPNYRGGGSAIFNPDMVRANGGLPQGAKKITASKGYVPNFAMNPSIALGRGVTLGDLTKGIMSGQYSAITVGKSYQIGKAGKTFSATVINKRIGEAKNARDAKVKAAKGKKATKNLFSVPAEKLAGGIGAIVGFATRSPSQSATTTSAFSTLTASPNIANANLKAYMNDPKNKAGKNAKSLQLTGIPIGAISRVGKRGSKSAKAVENKFSGSLNKFMMPALNRYTSSIFKDLLKDDGRGFIKRLRRNKKRVFSTSTEGGIMEASLSLAGRNAGSFGGDDMARFDFEESGTISDALASTFFKGKKVKRADAKRSDTAPNIKTLIAKSAGTKATSDALWAALVKQGATTATPKAAEGYVPNFVRGSLMHRLKGVQGAKGLIGPAASMRTAIESARAAGVFQDKEATKAFVKKFKKDFQPSGAHEAGIRDPGATAYNAAISSITGLNRQRSVGARTDEVNAALNRLNRITPAGIGKARKGIAKEYLTLRKESGLTKGIAAQKFDSADFSNLANYGSGSNRYTLGVSGGVLRANNVRQHEYRDAKVGNISIENHKNRQHVVLEDMSPKGPVKFPPEFKSPLMEAAAKYKYPTILRSKLTYEQANMSDVQRFRQGSEGYVPNFARMNLTRRLGGLSQTGMVTELLKKAGLSKGFVAGKKMVGKMRDTGWSLAARGGDNSIVQALNYLVRSFTVGSAKGLPMGAFLADAVAKYGIGAINKIMQIMKNLQAGNSALKGVTWKEKFGSTGANLPTFASGYVPNFGGLGAAISREKAAGIPSSAIRINSSPRFQNAQNPAGLAVTNKFDEPRGLADVPNFAWPSWMGGGGGGSPFGTTLTTGGPGSRTPVTLKAEKELEKQLKLVIKSYKKGNIERKNLGKIREGLTREMNLTKTAQGRVTTSLNKQRDRVDAARRPGSVAPGGAIVGGPGGRAGVGAGGGMGGIMAMMMVPMVGGMAEQAIGGQGGAAVSGGATGGMMGGMLGYMGGGAMATAGMFGMKGAAAGPWGAAAGIAIGATIGAITAWNASAESATEHLQNFTTELAASLGGATAYVASQKAMTEATTMEQFEAAANGAADALLTIDDPELRDALIENKNEFKELTKVIREYKEEEMKRILLEKGVAKLTETELSNKPFTTKAYMEAAGMQGQFLPGILGEGNPLKGGELSLHGYTTDPTRKGADPEVARKMEEAITQRALGPLLQYFQGMGLQAQDVGAIQGALNIPAGQNIGGQNPFAGRIDQGAIFNALEKLRKRDDPTQKLLDSDVSQRLADMVAALDPGGFMSGVTTSEEEFNKSKFLQMIMDNMANAFAQFNVKSKEDIRKVAAQRKAKFIFIEEFKKIVADVDQAILDSARITRDVAFQVSRRTTRQKARSDLLGKSRGRLEGQREAFGMTAGNLAIKRANIANPIIGAQARSLSSLIAEMNQKGGQGGINLQELTATLMDPLRAGNIMDVVQNLRERLAADPKQAGGLADQAVRTRAETMARNLEAAWGKGGQILDQQEMVLLDEHKINLVREEILKAERDIQYQKNEYLNGLKLQQVKEEILLKKQINALEMQGKDPRATRGMSILEKQGFTANLERQKIVARQDSEKKQFKFDTKLKRAEMEAQFLLNESTLTLVQSNAELFTAIESLTKAVGGTPVGAGAGGGTPEGRDKLKGQITNLGHLIQRDGAYSPEQVAEQEQRQKQLKGLKKKLAAYEIRYSQVGGGTGGALNIGLEAAGGRARSPMRLGLESGNAPPPLGVAVDPGLVYSKVGGGVGGAINLGPAGTKVDKGGHLAQKRAEIEKSIVGYKKETLNLETASERKGKALTADLIQQRKLFEDNVKLGEESIKRRGKADREIHDENAALQAKLTGRTLGPGAFAEGWGGGMERVKDDAETIFNLLGDQLPAQLRNGLVSAMEAGLDGAKSIGDAMRAMAVDVLKMIRHAFLQRIASNIVGALPGGPTDTSKRTGGLIRAQAGLFVPGTGSGDTVRANLEPGEYVLNRNAVAAMGGERALNKINFSAAPRFGNKMRVNEDPFSSRMSGLYYATGSPELEELAAKMREKDEERAAKKAEKRALWTSFATMVASAAVFKGMEVAKDKGWGPSNWGQKLKTGKANLGNRLRGGDKSTWVDIHGSAYSRMPQSQIDTTPTAWPNKQYGGTVGRYGSGSGYQAGGSVQALSSPASNTNNISINISTGSSDQQRSGASKQGGQDINADGGGTAREFSMKVAAAVRTVIAEEQRVGGTLSPGARRR